MRLTELASVGPFFALRTGGAPAGAAEYGPLLDGRIVRARVETVAERLGTQDRRVAASVAYQGIAGRLLSVALGSAVLTGEVPCLAGERLRWHPARTAPEDLWLPRPEAFPRPGAPQHAADGGVVGGGVTASGVAGSGFADSALAGLIREHVLHGPLAELHRTTREVVAVSGRLLWGNAASSLAGSLRVLHAWCREQGRPQDAARATALTRAVLADPVLRGTGTLATDGPPDAAPSFVRSTCCLYYRVPPGGTCGDCVLRHAPPRVR
ncbi:(2Fe-2S)-binding protein [Streptomyces sp. URMC 127]|uniref:(2Fe-2S)-binding protein n=1 Tax=Streptomyces sp. URMC 127 TaxID=3423402 RepID=UPI003F19C019